MTLLRRRESFLVTISVLIINGRANKPQVKLMLHEVYFSEGYIDMALLRILWFLGTFQRRFTDH